MSDIEVPKTPTIGAAEVAQHVEAGDIFLLDVRGGGGEQIYGAIRYDPKKLLEAERLVLPLPKSEGLIVLYDGDGTSSDTQKLAEKLRANDYATVRVLEGGFRDWQAAGGRTEDKTIEQPVPLASEHQLDR
jgi:rhodanese-related sulfurtransferase